MKNDIQQLNPSEISSEVFIIAPTQIEAIAKQFGTEIAETMHVRSLAQKISQTAYEILLKTLVKSKNMGAQ